MPTVVGAHSVVAGPVWRGADRHPHFEREYVEISVELVCDLPDEARELTRDRDGNGRAFLAPFGVEV